MLESGGPNPSAEWRVRGGEGFALPVFWSHALNLVSNWSHFYVKNRGKIATFLRYHSVLASKFGFFHLTKSVIAFYDENDESFTKSLCFSAESSRGLGVADIIGISKATCRKDLP